MSADNKQQGSPLGQKILLYVLLAGGLAAGIYMFVLTPLYEDGEKYTKEARELREKTETARREISNATKMNADFASLTAYIEPLTNNYVVHEELGSYPMERRIGELSTRLDLKVTSCSTPRKERTPSFRPEPPKGKKPAPKGAKPAVKESPCLDRLVLDVVIEGGYFAVAELLKELESENPFCGVRSLKITPGGTPERHKFSISLEWPVMADPVPVAQGGGRR